MEKENHAVSITLREEKRDQKGKPILYEKNLDNSENKNKSLDKYIFYVEYALNIFPSLTDSACSEPNLDFTNVLYFLDRQ